MASDGTAPVGLGGRLPSLSEAAVVKQQLKESDLLSVLTRCVCVGGVGVDSSLV